MPHHLIIALRKTLGFFVPFFALFLLWFRRDMIADFKGSGSWWGLPLFIVWAVMRWVAIYFNYGSLSEFSIIQFHSWWA